MQRARLGGETPGETLEKHSNDSSPESPELLGAGWFDPIEAAIRDRVRRFIEELVDAELDAALGRALPKSGCQIVHNVLHLSMAA